MFNLKKKFKRIDEYPEAWSIIQGARDNKPIFVRFRSGLKDAIGHPDYPFQIGVAVPLLHPTPDGLTTDQEAEQLNAIEDLLEKKIDKEGVFAMTITTNGMREFVFYTKKEDPEHFEELVKSIESKPHELQCIIQEDTQWDTFKKFTKL